MLDHMPGRSPRGERGLKYYRNFRHLRYHHRRSPRGERGLKYVDINRISVAVLSLPPRGAWIEILHILMETPRAL